MTRYNSKYLLYIEIQNIGQALFTSNDTASKKFIATGYLYFWLIFEKIILDYFIWIILEYTEDEEILYESLFIVKKFQTFERKCEAGTNFTKLLYVGKKENNPSLYFTRWHVKKSRKGETVSRYHPGRSLTYLEFENRIISISFAASLAPWEPFVSFWAPPSGFRARLAPNSIDCSSASLFVSSDGVYARQRYPLREL